MAGNEAHASRRDPIDQLDRTLHRRDGAHATQLGGPGVGAPLRELLRRELALGLEVSGAWLLRRRWMGESGEQSGIHAARLLLSSPEDNPEQASGPMERWVEV